MEIPVRTAEADREDMLAALDEAGCLVVTGLADATLRATIVDELAPHMERARVIAEDDPEAFYPGRTRRVTALLARSTAVTDSLLTHPLVQGVCDQFLLPNGEFGHQLHVTAALEVGPGARGQVLHREEDTFTFFELPRPNLIVAAMWAMTDFTVDNGATHIVPGSHRWDASRTPTPEEIVPAEMPAGAVLFWLGGLLHGAGANVSDGWRYGVLLTYSVGWVRQEENQYLDVPPERLAAMTPEARRAAGFDMHRALGFHDPSVQ